MRTQPIRFLLVRMNSKQAVLNATQPARGGRARPTNSKWLDFKMFNASSVTAQAAITQQSLPKGMAESATCRALAQVATRRRPVRPSTFKPRGRRSNISKLLKKDLATKTQRTLSSTKSVNVYVVGLVLLCAFAT